MTPRLNPISAAVADACSATINVFTSPLPGVEPITFKLPAGQLLPEHLPRAQLAWVCVANGVPLKREYWMQRRAQPGDVIEFHPVVLGGGGDNTSASILAVVAMVVLWFVAPYIAGALTGTAAGFGTAGYAALSTAGSLVAYGIVTVGSAIINALVAPQPPSLSGLSGGALSGPEASPTYSASAAGNAARIGGAIPVQYGRVKCFPDFAARPYTQYDTWRNSAGDEFFYALYALGHGEYDVEAALLQDTPLDRFRDVEYRILPPGTAPALVDPGVVTAIEVTGQTLDAEAVGPYAACGPARTVKAVGVDIVFPGGLGQGTTDGGINEVAVEFRIDFQVIDNAANPISGWEQLGVERIRASSRTPQRRSFYYDLPFEARVQVRVLRLTARVRDSWTFDEAAWSALRGHLAQPVPLAPTVTHMELKMRANEQLSGMSNSRIAVVATRKISEWTPEAGWSDPVPSRNAAWALADKWLNPVYGDALTEERIDLNALYRLSQTVAARQDRFDYRFDQRIDSAAADQLIARSCRAAVFRRNGKRTIVRDERNDLPVTAYTSRSILSGSVSLDYVQVTEETADGVIAEYFSQYTWSWEEIECPAPGRTYSDPAHPGYNSALPMMTNPVRVRMDGVTGPTQAEREGLYQAAANVLRRKYVTWATEMQGTLASFGSPVIFAPALSQFAQSGDVAFYRSGAGEVELTEPIDWSAGAQLFIAFYTRSGRVTAFTQISPGSNERSARFGGPPADVEFVLDDYGSERTQYVISAQQPESRSIVKLLGVRPKGRSEDGALTIEMAGVVENDAVHDVDAALLPAPGDGEQDPPDYFGDRGATPPPGSAPRVTLTDIKVTTYWADNPIGGARPEIVLRPDGTMGTKRWFPGTGIEEVGVPNQWLDGSPREPTIGAQYEWQIETSGALWPVGVPFEDLPNGVRRSPWISLANDINFVGAYGEEGVSFSGNRIATVFFDITIRSAATQIEQARATITLITSVPA